MVVQGFGNAGQFAASLGESILGLRLVGASDSKGGVYIENGVEAKKLIDYKKEKGTLAGFPGAKTVSNEELLEIKCTVLFPSALENTINEGNAQKIDARLICELANGPTTPEADAVLDKKGVIVLPDYLANAGGVTVSYFEQCQNAQNYYWTLEEVHKQLDRKMSDAFAAVHAMSVRKQTNLRDAAYLVSIARVAEACQLRGWV